MADFQNSPQIQQIQKSAEISTLRSIFNLKDVDVEFFLGLS